MTFLSQSLTISLMPIWQGCTRQALRASESPEMTPPWPRSPQVAGDDTRSLEVALPPRGPPGGYWLTPRQPPGAHHHSGAQATTSCVTPTTTSTAVPHITTNRNHSYVIHHHTTSTKQPSTTTTVQTTRTKHCHNTRITPFAQAATTSVLPQPPSTGTV